MYANNHAYNLKYLYRLMIYSFYNTVNTVHTIYVIHSSVGFLF